MQFAQAATCSYRGSGPPHSCLSLFLASPPPPQFPVALRPPRTLRGRDSMNVPHLPAGDFRRRPAWCRRNGWRAGGGRLRRISRRVAVSGARGLTVQPAGGSGASGAPATRTSTLRLWKEREFHAALKPAAFSGVPVSPPPKTGVVAGQGDSWEEMGKEGAAAVRAATRGRGAGGVPAHGVPGDDAPAPGRWERSWPPAPDGRPGYIRRPLGRAPFATVTRGGSSLPD